MKSTLIASVSFLCGSLLGTILGVNFCINAIEHAPLDKVAERAVKDVASAYEAQLEKSGISERLTDKFNHCVKENARLSRNQCSGEGSGAITHTEGFKVKL